MDVLASLDVVLVHDWLTGMRGGEKCLQYFCQRWPAAPLYTLLHRRGSVSAIIEQHPVHTSFLQWFPAVSYYYRYLLPLMPSALNWRLPSCDLVLSSSHCVAKSALPPAGVPHVCYCFTPMRYAWHMKDSYFASAKRGLKDWLRDQILSRIREWDRKTAEHVTHFVAISKTVQQRIYECYGRDSVVIYPPVDTEFYYPSLLPRGNYYLIVSAFAPYKRLDLAISACTQLNRQLVIIGQGQDEKKLRQLAGPTVHFLGWQPNEIIRDHLRRCQALLFPGEEDFGIVPIEAQACGTPVIAFGRGGATETVVPPGRAQEPTGLWFEEQTVECVVEALTSFEKMRTDFRPVTLRRHAVHYRGERFAEQIFTYLAAVIRGTTPEQRRAA